MTSTPRRPVFLNLFLIRFPMAAVMSVIHRASGAVMVLAIPGLLYLLERSLSGPEGFAAMAALFSGWFGKALLFIALWSLIHHLYAGTRYLLIDVDIGVERPIFRYTAWLVTLSAPLTALLITWGMV